MIFENYFARYELRKVEGREREEDEPEIRLLIDCLKRMRNQKWPWIKSISNFVKQVPHSKIYSFKEFQQLFGISNEWTLHNEVGTQNFCWNQSRLFIEIHLEETNDENPELIQILQQRVVIMQRYLKSIFHSYSIAERHCNFTTLEKPLPPSISTHEIKLVYRPCFEAVYEAISKDNPSITHEDLLYGNYGRPRSNRYREYIKDHSVNRPNPLFATLEKVPIQTPQIEIKYTHTLRIEIPIKLSLKENFLTQSILRLFIHFLSFDVPFFDKTHFFTKLITN